MEWTVQLCLLCVQVCVLTTTSLQAPHRGALPEEGILDNKNTEEVLDELWNQVEAVTDAPFLEVERCQHRPGGCSPIGRSSRTKRQTGQRNRRPRNRPGSGGPLCVRPSDTRMSGCLSPPSVRQSSRTKRQEQKRPRSRPGSGSALRPGPPDPNVLDPLRRELPSQDVSP